MKTPRLLAALALLLLCLLPALAPGQLGVNVHSPAKPTSEPGETAAFRSLLSSLPRKTALRDNLLFHEWAWDSRYAYGFENIDAKVELDASLGGVAVFEITPIPWPGSVWTTFGPWGFVYDREIPLLSDRFAALVAHVRAKWKALGRNEADLRFQIGNEPGAGHPGGWEVLPKGAWWSTHGQLYLACLKKAKFGSAKVIAPALSFLDTDAAAREKETAAPILKALKPYVDYFAVHSRLYRPDLPPAEWARESLRVLKEREAYAASFGKPAVCTEWYCAAGDVGGDPADALAEFAKVAPAGTWLYRVGPGPTDASFEFKPAAFSRASSTSSL